MGRPTFPSGGRGRANVPIQRLVRLLGSRHALVLVEENETTQGCPVCFQQTRPVMIPGPPLQKKTKLVIRRTKQNIKGHNRRIKKLERSVGGDGDDGDDGDEARRPGLGAVKAKLADAKDLLSTQLEARQDKIQELRDDAADRTRHASRESRFCDFCHDRKNRDITGDYNMRTLTSAQVSGQDRPFAFDTSKLITAAGRGVKKAELLHAKLAQDDSQRVVVLPTRMLRLEHDAVDRRSTPVDLPDTVSRTVGNAKVMLTYATACLRKARHLRADIERQIANEKQKQKQKIDWTKIKRLKKSISACLVEPTTHAKRLAAM